MRTKNSVAEVAQYNQCIGCGACELACPHNAISMGMNKSAGVYNPIIEKEKCVQCGICLEVCFGANTEYKHPSEVFDQLGGSHRRIQNTYSGFAKEDDLRFQSSSGGVVTALLSYMLDSGVIDAAIVACIEPGNPPLAKSHIATTKPDIREAMGSKYCPVLISNALKAMKLGARYVFVGLPCHIYSVKKLVKQGRLEGRIEAYLGLFCGGTLSYNGTRYLLREHGFHDAYVNRIEYRGGGWPGRLLAETTRGVLEEPFQTYWPRVARWFYLDRCMTCLSSFNLNADVSFGDSWLDETIQSDSMGTSVMCSLSKKGEKILLSAATGGYVEIKQTTLDFLMRSQKMMLYFKHLRFFARLRALSLLRKKNPLSHRYSEKHGYGFRYIFDEILILIGRFFASRESCWNLFDMYQGIMKFYGYLLKALRKS